LKIAKKLIKLGAEIDIVDNKNRKPVDIAITKKFKSMEKLFNEKMYIKCNYNTYQKNKSLIYPLLFIVYFLIKEFFTVFIVSFYIDSNKLILLSIMTILVLFILKCILLFNVQSNEKMKLNNSLLSLFFSGENLKTICAFCNIKKDNYTFHCYYCKKCVESYDHHCIWLSNCIGKSNLFTFRVFLIWILFKIVINTIISLKSNLSFKVDLCIICYNFLEVL